ncbi:MAG: penicillin-binding protein 2 [Hyphomicrobiaceae bacterium]
MTRTAAPNIEPLPESRTLVVVLGVAALFAALALQLIWLGFKGHGGPRLSISEPIVRTFARPDIVDRNGRQIATDLEAPSLYADPALILDVDEAAEKLAEIFPDIDQLQLRVTLADKSRRFVWIRRGLSPRTAQRVHDLGLPGLSFRRELKRSYPLGQLAGHVIGAVNIDNRGLSGIEKHIDEAIGIEAVLGARPASNTTVQLSIDIGVQFALEDELARAVAHYTASGAAGLVMAASTGEIIAAASLPNLDPARQAQGLDPARLDKNFASTFELGSIFKLVTIAQALDSNAATADTVIDVRAPLRIGRHQIRDLHAAGRPLTVRDIFVQSSNVGAARLALAAGAERQQIFLSKLGLLRPGRTEAGPIAAPNQPERWGEVETATIAFGHGLAVAPVRFVAAAATLLNGGTKVEPTLLRSNPTTRLAGDRVVAPETSAILAQLMRRNVTLPTGTGRRAEVAGYEIGGKTGTAEIAVGGKYRGDQVMSSFLATFPASRPEYILLVTLDRPQPAPETGGQITAGHNAAPVAGRVIGRIGPLLRGSTGEAPSGFDASRDAK